MPTEVVSLLAENWLWLIGGGLLALIIYWIADEAGDAADRVETVERVTDRAERATGGVLSGTRALLVGFVGIGLTAAGEVLGLAAVLNELLGGVPYLVGMLLYGGLSLAGIYVDVRPSTLGIAFVIVFLVVSMIWIGNRDGRAA
ncbi:hypothetical protein [Halobaculum rubrum]|uniref:hypothetical protein n=1 Tax=Halobaculum rubrum TaxID=2872158 RepID=UPI001CA3EBEA|nr:hypothetical protein [Halobaculum rubrum]QZX98730.1 hypothetical protein K6T25_10640 [Halobaculum rubrum]